MYSGGFYPFPDNETGWAWWARHIYFNRYIEPPKPVYKKLLSLIENKNYFVITTNVDHQFQRAGFDKKRLFEMYLVLVAPKGLPEDVVRKIDDAVCSLKENKEYNAFVSEKLHIRIVEYGPDAAQKYMQNHCCPAKEAGNTSG